MKKLLAIAALALTLGIAAPQQANAKSNSDYEVVKSDLPGGGYILYTKGKDGRVYFLVCNPDGSNELIVI